MSSSNTPCAACKLQRRKCTQECVFAPYFPPDNPRKFYYVHRVFGASNVAKLLGELNVAERDEAVKSLAYEAEARLKDPVYGCVGLISVLQQKLKAIQGELNNAKKELATYIGPQALQPMGPILAPHGMITQQHHHQGNLYGSPIFPYNNVSPQTMAGIAGAAAAAPGGPLVIRDPHQQHQHHHHAQQQMLEAQQLAVAMGAREPQEMFGGYDQLQQLQQQEFLRFNSGGGFELGSVSGSGFNQPAEMSPSLALGTFENPFHQMQLQQAQGEYYHHHHQPPHHQLQAQLLLPPSQPQPQSQQHHHQQQSESEEGRGVGPSC